MLQWNILESPFPEKQTDGWTTDEQANAYWSSNPIGQGIKLIRIMLNKLKHLKAYPFYHPHMVYTTVSGLFQKCGNLIWFEYNDSKEVYIYVNQSLYSDMRMRRPRPHTLSTTATSHVTTVSWSMNRSQNGKLKNQWAIIHEITKFDLKP